MASTITPSRAMALMMLLACGEWDHAEFNMRSRLMRWPLIAHLDPGAGLTGGARGLTARPVDPPRLPPLAPFPLAAAALAAAARMPPPSKSRGRELGEASAGARPWSGSDMGSMLAMQDAQAAVMLAADAPDARTTWWATQEAARRARQAAWGWYGSDGHWRRLLGATARPWSGGGGLGPMLATLNAQTAVAAAASASAPAAEIAATAVDAGNAARRAAWGWYGADGNAK